MCRRSVCLILLLSFGLTISVTSGQTSVKINFQQTGSETPEGYLPDTSQVFGDRGNGFSYGWDVAFSETRDRNSANAPDQRYDTLNHLQKGGARRMWEIALDNGIYDIFLVCGDPDNTDQTNNFDVEGTVLTDLDGQAGAGFDFDEFELTVVLSDGRLTIQPADGADNCKICFVNITLAGAARNPKPANEATDVPRDAVLSWTPGIFAPPINGHTVYLSENFNDVNDGVGGIAHDANSYAPDQRLDFGTTYYWRVDEVNGPPDYTVYPGDVWQFTTESTYATQPEPANNAVGVVLDKILSWSPGLGAVTHDVYFSDNFTDVNDGTGRTYKGPVVDPTYTPTTLELGKVYYWRIDEFDGSATHKGDVWSFTTSAQLWAFPGAEGAGRHSTGGRGGDVYHVTNLNDSDAGSLRYGLESAAGPRIIVFDVSGNIELQSNLSIGSDITIAGQTAPGDGITICNRRTKLDGDNVIVRYIRFRPGDVYCPGYEPDSLWISGADNVIVDHVSTSWGIDEVLSATHGSSSVTVQWSMVTEALHNSCHSKGNHGYGSLINGGDFTFHHNLYAHNRSRNPRPGVGEPGTRLDWVNNVVYNPGGRFGYGDGSAESPLYINYVGNYGIGGPNTDARNMHHSAEPYTHIYQSGNIMDLNKNSLLDGTDNGWAMFSGPEIHHSTRFDLPEVTTHSALEAYNLVLAEAGASLVRDAVDNRVIETVSNQTGAHIDSQWEVGGWPELNSEAAPLDADQDGMPDDWELAHGLDPNEPSDANGDRNGDGYTNIEEYINWMPTRHKETPPPLGFETADFSGFNWIFSGDANWTVTSQERNSGTYSAQVGSIDHRESTTLQVTLECVSGDITFYRKVSSESGFDYLKFYIDGVEEGKWSGEKDWAEVSFPVTAGTRTFEWTYSKDGSTSTGDDTAWIDDIVFPSRMQSIESSLVYEGIDGHLVYGTYANEGQTNSVNIIPDFSHCGYMDGGVAIPDVPVATTLSPQNGDDTQMIQDAIDYVSSRRLDANGFRGAVLLTAGRYQVSSSLTITAGGVVLRGQGQDVLGTVLEATGAYNYDVIDVKGTGGYSEQSATIRLITSSYVPVGAYSFDIENTSGYSVGDWIIVQRTPNQFWIDELAMGQYDWAPDSYNHKYERYVVDITGNTITIDSPIVDIMEDRYGSGRIYKSSPLSRLNQCGVENLRIESTYTSDTGENHPWDAVVLQDVEDCWVRKVTARYFAYSCVKVESESTCVTIEDCAFLDPKSIITGGRRYAFVINAKANHILFQRCYAAYARHSYVTGSRVPGPNVFVDCYAYNSYSDSGPHHRWATGTLFDNVRDSKQIHVQNRGPSGTGHGWAGAQQVLWNCQSGSIICEAPKGAMNFAIGCSGTRNNGRWIDEPDGWWEHQEQSVSPRSLYYKQLEDRLGMPAVENVTMPEQWSGGIWPDLADWAGDYTFQSRPIESNMPSDERLEIGSDAIFEVVPLAGATILEYQWYELSGSSYVPIGNNAVTLTIPNMQAEDEGREFFCRVITNKGPFCSRKAAICYVDYNLRLVEDFEALSGSPDEKAATGASGGTWDTQGESTGNVRVITIDNSQVLRYFGHSGGSSRGVMVSGLSNPIRNNEAGLLFFRLMLRSDSNPPNHYMGITDLNLDTDPDAMDGAACYKENVVAGFGVLSADNGSNGMDVVTTDETATVLARIVPGRWYNVWIVADNTNDTYDLYLSATEGPGTPTPGRPLAKDLIGEGLTFGKRTTRSLSGAMFFTEATTGPTKWTYVDDIYWSAP